MSTDNSSSSSSTTSTSSTPSLQLRLVATTYPLVPLDQCTPQHTKFEEVCADLVERGYGALDIAVLHILLLGKTRFLETIKKYNLKFMAKVYSSGHPGSIPALNPTAFTNATIPHPVPGLSVEEHIAVVTAQIREATTADLRPYVIGIASQSGRDRFSHEQGGEADTYFTAMTALSDELSIPIYHETHRHRLLFNPWDTVRILNRHPKLQLLGDLSHYCVVCEVPPDDAELNVAIKEILPRIGHIHARVGFEEGPQILDPREPRWAKHVQGHMNWWKQVFLLAKKRGDKEITVTPEFLPPPYAWCHHGGDEPFPGKAVVNIHEINHYMARIVKELFIETMKEE